MTLPARRIAAPDCQLNWEALDGMLRWGTGDPEGVVRARIGALFLREDGGAGTTLYVKEADSGQPTGWVAK